jgi:hypothetical protein
MAVEVFTPFVSPYEFFDEWVCASGPTATATRRGRSIHADYSPAPATGKHGGTYGEERAKAILGEAAQHHPVSQHDDEGADPDLRIFKPIAVDKTLVESGPSDSWVRQTAARAHADVQPPDQRADLGRRPRRPEVYERAQEGASRGRTG